MSTSICRSSLAQLRRAAASATFAFATVLVSLALGGAPITSSAADAVNVAASNWPADATALLQAHRELIVLGDDALAGTPNSDALATRVGLYVAHESSRLRQALIERLIAALDRRGESGVGALLDLIESDPALHDGDKLAFIDVLGELRSALDERNRNDEAARALGRRLDEDLRALAEVRARYDREIGEIRARFGLRGMTLTREAWSSYVAFLRRGIDRDALLQRLAPRVDARDEDRGSTPGSTTRPRANEVNGTGLPAKTLVLTFDDGPHARFTDRILAILARYDAPAVFFQVGRNLGAVGTDGATVLHRGSEVARRIVAAGHTIANHSYSHANLPTIPPQSTAREIDDTQALLQAASPAAAPMFRAPYGARNASVLAELGIRRLQSVMWNIDSRDWADPVPASIAQRVVDEVTQQGRGIVLFHDIHERTVEALPLVLDALLRDGYRFAAWNDGQFAVRDASRRGDGETARASPAPTSVYGESYAVVIGVDEYTQWPKLRHAVADARGMGELLVRRFGFRPENVFTLLNGEATRDRIMGLLAGTLADSRRVKRDDRVLVFYAGHGATRRLPSGRDLGYIIPVDAPQDAFQGRAISMSEFQDIVDAIPAKHVLFLMDSCYSGLALTRGGATSDGSTAYLREIGRRAARQMLTAGGADQQVADGGPGGHSIFTWTLLQGLEGKADANGDGVITATELAAHVAPVVASLSRQTPAFGNMPGGEGGDFAFELAGGGEYLSAQSRQLDDEAVRLNAAIERLRNDVAAKEARNRKLREDLARAEATARGEAEPRPAAEPAPPTAIALNEEGTALFRERRYDEALARFRAAVAADSGYALAANNLGFTHYARDELAEAVRWFERTVTIDPNRAVAHLNLGDALAKLGRVTEARAAYGRYLALAPEGRAAKYVREQLQIGAARP